VTIAPSGRPLAAIVYGSIAFTAKISGVPDLLLTLSAPGGISRTLELPVFHPCVRLARWRERPGELSFVPPDGRFVLAGYEVDILPLAPDDDKPPSHTEKLFLPASVDLQNSLGPNGADFEVRLNLSTSFPGASSSSRPGTTSRYSGTATPSFLSGVGNNSGSSSAPALEELIVTVPIPPTVRNLTDLRPSRGEAHFTPGDRAVEWRVPTKDAGSIAGTATLRCTVVGPLSEEDAEEAADELGVNNTINPLIGYYDESSASEPYQSASTSTAMPSTSQPGPQSAQRTSQRKIQLNAALMPTSASVSFSVKGWLPSGIRVEGLVIDSRKSKGLGEGVRPYKGVKYICVSQKGVERRV
jgi:AP-3 complex subunit mu